MLRSAFSALRAVILCLGLVSGCERPSTRAELEHEVLRVTFRYFYDHDAAGQVDTAPKVIFVGTPGEYGEFKGQRLIEALYRDPSPEWQTALAETGIATRPASAASYDPASVPAGGALFYRDPETGERALVFCIDRITFPKPDTATVVCSSAVAPTNGGQLTYQLLRESRGWRVVDSRVTSVY